jgi:hypothetical protein
MHHFTLNRDDFAALVTALNANVSPKDSTFSIAFGLRVVVWVAIAYTFYGCAKAYALGTIANTHLVNAVIGAAITALLATTSYVYTARRTVKRLLAEDGWFLAPQSMRFHEDGIEHESNLGHANFRWQAFIQRIEDSERFFLLVEPGQGFVVPKRVLQEAGVQDLIRAKVPQ